VGSKLYVGNLAYSMSDESLQTRFSEYGNVVSAKVMMDRDSGRSKGFGFVEMSSSDEAQAAIRGLHGKSIEGRDLVVNEARPKESSGFGGGPRREFSAGGGDRGGRRSY
jgi:RNA recognition motif-containing protein